MRRLVCRCLAVALVAGTGVCDVAAASTFSLSPDIVVAADGSGDFKSVHAAVQSIPRDNRERRIILVKDGVYHEKVRVEAACVTLRGENRKGTRIEFAQPNSGPRDDVGRAVVNLTPTAHDFVLENLTVENTDGVLGRHAFAVFGLADRTVIIDCDIRSQGNDTLSLWRGRAENAAEIAAARTEDDDDINPEGGRYYHARLNISGSVDFICPRGWCYMTQSTITELNPSATAAVWHDGSNVADKKFVMRDCRFDGPPDWYLARRHHDAHFYFIDCWFSAAMRNRAPYRVIYPLNGGTPTEADIARNKHYDQTNVFGERAYYFNSRRAGGDYAWHADNLADAPGAPHPEQITAAWTFAGTWDPERTDGPEIKSLVARGSAIDLVFTEPVTVKGSPQLALRGGAKASYATGSGTRTLSFAVPANASGDATSLNLADGAIVASRAYASIRFVNPSLPSTR